jgi:hypothetical protein
MFVIRDIGPIFGSALGSVLVVAGLVACSSSSSTPGVAGGGTDAVGGLSGSSGAPGGGGAGAVGVGGGNSLAGNGGTGTAGASVGGSAGALAGGAGGSAAGSAGSGGGTSAPAVGANTPFISYEAEAGTPGGGATVVSLTAAPTSQYSSPELESSGHAYVNLNAAGQYVEWTNNTGKAITFFNVRAAIPDSPGGGGITSTINVYVDGTMRQALPLSSKQTWGYEGNNHYNNVDSDNPADGDPRKFFDDAHAFVMGAAIAPGSKIRLQKDAANDAAFYYIDVIDLEAPPPVATQPAGSLSITDYGAKANDINTDSTNGIQSCINAAQTQQKTVWIPPGTFYLNTTKNLVATGITIEGAGMWYSTIYRNVPNGNASGQAALFNVTSCTVKSFALDSNAPSRSLAAGAMDTTGTNWLADGIWTMHTLSGFWASGTGGTVQNCRLISIWADGCNLNNVSLTGTVGSNLTAKNNFVRGTGDDAMAINSVDYNGNTHYTPMSNITMENNTTITPWGGKGIGIYGGSGHVVQNNYISDCARFIGLGVGKFGVNGSDLTSATVTGNTVTRCGGNAFMQQQPALHIGNGGDGQGVGNVGGAKVTNNIIDHALYNGVGFSTSMNDLLQGNMILSPGMNGIVVSPPFYPAPTGSATIIGNTVTGLAPGMKEFINNSAGFAVTMQ